MREPSYLALHRNGELARRAEQAVETLRSCHLCGWDCGIDRSREHGPCRTGTEVSVATAYIHFGEEYPLVASGGSGAIFFANCELRCRFCQTARWNVRGDGQVLTEQELARVMLDLQHKGAANINLVTPTHITPQILAALSIAVEDDLRLPLVWNSGGYDSLQALTLLDGVVDIYLPDMKYSDAELARRLSGVQDYPRVNQQAVIEMHRQVGDLQLHENGAAGRGVLLRHLVLPNHLDNTTGVLKWIAEHLGLNTYLSLMDQYRPAHRADELADIERPVSADEYTQARHMAESLGLRRLDDHLILNSAPSKQK